MPAVGKGPYHDFWLLREGERPYKGFSDLYNRPDVPVLIGDDLIRVLHPTLEWIPSFNPSGQRRQRGLNYEGITIVNHEGGAMFHHVWTTWALMVSKAPDPVTLGGHWWDRIGDDEQPTGERGFEPYIFDRGELVTAFQILAYFGTKTETGKVFIVHLGI